MNFYAVSIYDEDIINTVLEVFEKYPNYYFSVGNVLRNIDRFELTRKEIHYNNVKWILQKLHSNGKLTRKLVRGRRYVYRLR